jgi:DNA primase
VAAAGAWARDRLVLLAFDNDSTGEHVVNATAAALYQHGARLVRRVVWPSPCKDACDLLAQRGAETLAKILTTHSGEVGT